MRLLTFLILPILVGCNPVPSRDHIRSLDDQTVHIKTIQPVKASLFRVVELPGTIAANQETHLYVKLPGYVKKYHFDIGQHVKGPSDMQGDLLAELVIPELASEAAQKLALKQQAEAELMLSHQFAAIARENVHAMTALVDEGRFAIKRAEASYTRWESERDRVAKLVANRTIDQQIGDETLNQYLSAKSTLDEAKAHVVTAEAMAKKSIVEKDKADADIKVAEAKVQVAAAEAQRLQTLLRYTQIRAPYNGIVTARHVEAGQFVQPLGSPMAVPLFTISNIETVRIVVSVPEADSPTVRIGDQVDITVGALKGEVFHGTVSRTSNSLDPGSRTLRTEVDIPNPKRILWPGMYIQARLTSKLPPRWQLPASAITQQGDLSICFLLDNDKVVRTPVRTGRANSTFIEVISKLKPGTPDVWVEWDGSEVVANSNVAYLIDGQVVTVDTPAPR